MFQRFLDSPYAFHLGLSLGLGLLFLLVYVLLRRVAARKASQRTKETLKLLKYVFLGLFLAVMAYTWLEDVRTLATIVGVIAATMVIALKEPILNLFGSTVIFWREIFTIGERIQVGTTSGDVVDKGLLYFTLMEVGGEGRTRHSTGRLVKVPNHLVLVQPIMNSTRGSGHVWHELRFRFSLDSDHAWCVQVLEKLARDFYEQEKIDKDMVKSRMARKNVHYRTLDPKAYVGLHEDSLRLTLRSLCPARRIALFEDFITSRLLERLAEESRATLLGGA